MGFMWSLDLSLQLLFLYSLFSLTVTNCVPFIQPMPCHEDDSHALLQFKEGFVISKLASENPLSYPKVASWNASTDCCSSWDGIQCDEHTGHVIGIDLSSSQLYGYLDSNSSLFNLAQLQILDLADNDFNYSQIPSRIGEFSKLTHLNLSLTSFSGEVPQEVSHLSKLLSLDLRCYMGFYSEDQINLLQIKNSTLRSLIQNSTSLETLRLNFVTIASPVPDVLTNLTSLQYLSLFHCELYGEFPDEIFHLPNLRIIDLGNNQNLRGKFPDFHSGALISALRLAGTSFYGTLPASIGKLSSLKRLSISNCQFSGSIPSSLGNLTQLTYLDLGFNEFTTKTISWICKLSQINYLGLGFINIGSDIPSCFVNLTQLSQLYLAHTNLTGAVPSWIMNLTNFANLRLDGNNLRGEIPTSIFKLENLEFLDLGSNLLQGKLELDKFLNLHNLYFLSLSDNQLSLIAGNKSFNATLSPIEYLGLAACNLVEFPIFFGALGQLTYLYMPRNSVNSIPSWMWRKISLEGLIISDNSLTGKISPLICNLKYLVNLDLSFNKLSGTIPSCLGSFSQSLQSLELQENHLSGLIPQTYMTGSALKMIDLSYNNMRGQLPRALLNCTMLEYLSVGYNKINDSFPFWLGALPGLKVIALSNNQLHGPIGCPKACSFSKLHIIDLSHNKLSGSLPSQMILNWESMKASNMSQLQYEQNWAFQHFGNENWYTNYSYSYTMVNKGVARNYLNLQKNYNLIGIDLSSNRISREIPDVVGDLKGLVLLNLSNNMFTGNIPSSLGKLSNLEVLDLSLNSLSGTIPQQLTELTFLEFINVSFNNLSGRIPENKQFSTFQDNSFEGNQGLCGTQLLKKCENHVAPPSASNGEEDSGSLFEFDWKIVLIGYGGGLVAGVALGSSYAPQVLRWLKKFF
ncbi:receptor-like protein Cf-9 [Lotus japonicus]|uniref:receptor-like protein Cf-9 n=1 Tax=Lotus japonicus TaxID=34305 RepID=UPI0025850CF7|nr:receptor-like protein Cf-9 [Lotus japonicus]